MEQPVALHHLMLLVVAALLAQAALAEVVLKVLLDRVQVVAVDEVVLQVALVALAAAVEAEVGHHLMGALLGLVVLAAMDTRVFIRGKG
jgi:hypothetical protein